MTETPEKALKLKEELEKASPVFEKMTAIDRAREEQWQREIANLEQRVHTEVIEVDLGGGTSIAVRACLTDSEEKRLSQLEAAREAEQDDEKRVLLTCQTIELITANPYITAEWLMENRESYSPRDVLMLLLGFREVRLKERMRSVMLLQSAIKFREKQGRAELRELSASSTDNRSA